MFKVDQQQRVALELRVHNLENLLQNQEVIRLIIQDQKRLKAAQSQVPLEMLYKADQADRQVVNQAEVQLLEEDNTSTITQKHGRLSSPCFFMFIRIFFVKLCDFSVNLCAIATLHI